MWVFPHLTCSLIQDSTKSQVSWQLNLGSATYVMTWGIFLKLVMS